jgi:hypothetical protein
MQLKPLMTRSRDFAADVRANDESSAASRTETMHRPQKRSRERDLLAVEIEKRLREKAHCSEVVVAMLVCCLQ